MYINVANLIEGSESMEASADYGSEYPVEKMRDFVLLLAQKSRLLIGKSVLLQRLPDQVAGKLPIDNHAIEHILNKYKGATGVALTIVGINAQTGAVRLKDSIRQERTLINWDVLLLAMYSKQE